MSPTTLKTRFKTATNRLLDQREASGRSWAAAATAGDWTTAAKAMKTQERAFATYANAIKALPWPAAMRADAKAVQAAAVKCSLDANVLSTATSEYDPAYTTYAPALLSDWTDLGAKILVLNADL